MAALRRLVVRQVSAARRSAAGHGAATLRKASAARRVVSDRGAAAVRRVVAARRVVAGRVSTAGRSAARRATAAWVGTGRAAGSVARPASSWASDRAAQWVRTWPARSLARWAQLWWEASRDRAWRKRLARAAARHEAALREAERRHEALLAREATRHESVLRTVGIRREAVARQRAQRRAELVASAQRRVARRRELMQKTYRKLVSRERARKTRRRRLFAVAVVLLLVTVTGVSIGLYYVDKVPMPAELALPESTTVYFADGVTPMAKLGTENRTIIDVSDMNDAVTEAIVAAEDRGFWNHRGVAFGSVLRALWNNVTGGPTQGASTITQQYVRIAADLKGLSYARKAREAIMAWKMDGRYSKLDILGFYLNTVPFGRGAYGVEAAAQAFFGKTVRRSAPEAQQVTVSEAMVLASLVKQPEPDPADPQGSPGYDPARGGRAAANARSRWEYVREGMVALGYLTRAEADALEYPHTVRSLAASTDGMDRPTGLVVNHALSELRQNEPFKGQASDYIRNGGFRIITTVDGRAQDVAEAAADIRRPTAPGPVRGQPPTWQAALVAVQPGTGRVLAYYGGNTGSGADHAGWYVDENGQAVGFGEHPPGSSFKVYDLAEALHQQVSVFSHWDSPAVKEFPASGRTKQTPAGPVRNASTAPCQPDCTLWEATVASLNVTFFELTEKLGPANVIDMARRAGIDAMWTDQPSRVDLRGRTGAEVLAANQGPPVFSTEVGIGQYGVTVLDHANGMATFAAGGKRAQAHFVKEVTRHGDLVYAEQLTQSDIGLTEAQLNELTWTLSQVPSAKLANGWPAAGKTGTWQAASSTTENAHTWMVGYTKALAVAVWLGTTDGKALITSDGKHEVFGSTHPAAIWRQFMVDATRAMALDPTGNAVAVPSQAPLPTTTAAVN